MRISLHIIDDMDESLAQTLEYDIAAAHPLPLTGGTQRYTVLPGNPKDFHAISAIEELEDQPRTPRTDHSSPTRCSKELHTHPVEHPMTRSD